MLCTNALKIVRVEFFDSSNNASHFFWASSSVSPRNIASFMYRISVGFFSSGSPVPTINNINVISSFEFCLSSLSAFHDSSWNFCIPVGSFSLIVAAQASEKWKR